MKGEFYSTWQLRRKQGKGRFVLVTILLWSLCTTILFFMIMAVTKEQYASFGTFLFALPVFWLFGIPVALIMWHRNEKKWFYWRSLAKKPKPSNEEEASSQH